MKALDLKNQKFNRLTVLECIGYEGKRKLWKCRCDCGNIVNVVTFRLTTNKIKSCGCLRNEKLIERSTKHNMRYSRIYNTWRSMRSRCSNPKNSAYKNYGGRNIKVCDEWQNSFKAFCEWSLKNGYKDDLTIDRINNDGNYEPSNCRWVDRKIQNNNTRHNRLITYQDKTMNISQWAEYVGLTYSCLKTRLYNGWSIEKALTTPVKKR